MSAIWTPRCCYSPSSQPLLRRPLRTSCLFFVFVFKHLESCTLLPTNGQILGNLIPDVDVLLPIPLPPPIPLCRQLGRGGRKRAFSCWFSGVELCSSGRFSCGDSPRGQSDWKQFAGEGGARRGKGKSGGKEGETGLIVLPLLSGDVITSLSLVSCNGSMLLTLLVSSNDGVDVLVCSVRMYRWTIAGKPRSVWWHGSICVERELHMLD
ncbi:unnamed protein product [Choristocarpus tenellus]